MPGLCGCGCGCTTMAYPFWLQIEGAEGRRGRKKRAKTQKSAKQSELMQRKRSFLQPEAKKGET